MKKKEKKSANIRQKHFLTKKNLVWNKTDEWEKLLYLILLLLYYSSIPIPKPKTST